jgi:hypothetical protein
MSVRVDGEIAHLVGDCRVEDAEPLLTFLQSGADRAVDLTEAAHLHTAVVQMLLAFRPQVIGPAPDTFVQRWLMPQITAT